jgi:hypothetical protein
MVNAHDLIGASKSSILPQHLIEVLGQLQARTANTVSSSIYIYDLVDQHTFCTSYPVAVMLGYTAEAIHAMGPVGLASFIHPDDLNQVAAHYQRFSMLLPGEVISVEYRMQRANGKWCRLRSQETSLVQAIDGFPLQVLGLLQVITQPAIDPSKKLTRLRQAFKQRRTPQRAGILATDRK